MAGPDALRGLRAITGLRGLVRRVLVHPEGRARVTEDGVEVWPVGRLIEAVSSGTLWP